MRSQIVVGTALLVLLSAAGCAATPADTSPPAPTPTATAADVVAPADGPELIADNLDGVNVIRFNLPADVEWRVRNGDTATTYLDDQFPVDVYLNTNLTLPSRDLDQYADITADGITAVGPTVERLADRTVSGVDGYVLEGSDDRSVVYLFGAEYGDSSITIKFEFTQDDPRVREWIESALASVEWL